MFGCLRAEAARVFFAYQGHCRDRAKRHSETNASVYVVLRKRPLVRRKSLERTKNGVNDFYVFKHSGGRQLIKGANEVLRLGAVALRTIPPISFFPQVTVTIIHGPVPLIKWTLSWSYMAEPLPRTNGLKPVRMTAWDVLLARSDR